MKDERAAFEAAVSAEMARSGSCVSRFILLDETPSTQDAARIMCGGEPGLLVVALRQTHGRGRLGREWADTSQLGLAATFVLPGTFAPDVLSIACGLASLRACEAFHAKPDDVIGVRWPNDVVVTRAGARERKMSGVLIERSNDLYFAGIGINVLQRESDFPPDLREKATSLSMLGAKATRSQVCSKLVAELSQALAATAEQLSKQWRRRDVLVGSHRAFVFNGERFEGTVRSIDPSGAIALETAEGSISLPAISTSMIHE